MPATPLMERTLEEVIIALCADFDRRQTAIKEKALPKRVLLEYKFLNLRILEGAMDIVGIKDAKIFIDDIGARRGYAKSCVDGISEPKYKVTKACVKKSSARKLSLMK